MVLLCDRNFYEKTTVVVYKIQNERNEYMKGLKQSLLEEELRLQQIIKETKARLVDAPKGRLRLSKSNGQVQYYQYLEKSKKGIYIPKDKQELAKKLAQKSYDEKVLHLAEKRYSQITKLTKDYEDEEIEKMYVREHIERQKLIVPVEMPWEQKMDEWKQMEYKGKAFQEGCPVILTEKGERVRSKSEKIMADYFFRHGIEYKYECPLYLEGVGTIYLDFTFLSKKSRKEVYWEHCGMIDDPNYARNMVRKIHAYEKNNIFQGERLILTYETEQMILSTGKIEQLVKRYLI